jgi:hypothetical protein
LKSYLNDLYAIRQSLKNGDATWKDVAEVKTHNGSQLLSPDSMRRAFNVFDLFDEAGWIREPYRDEDDICYEEKDSYNNELLNNEKHVDLSKIDKTDPKSIMIAHGFSPDEYVLVSAKDSIWDKDNQTTLHSSRIVVRPKNVGDITFEDIDEYFAKYDNILPIYIKPVQYAPDAEFLEVCLQDTHIGLLSYGAETGEDYDVNIACERIEQAIADVVVRCEGRKFSRVVFSLIGDILHVDNSQNTTTKGIKQDVDTRISKMFDKALDVLINSICLLGNIAPVDVFSVPGNHDATLSYMLVKAVETAFKKDDNVQFYNSPSPRKWKRYGKVLIGWAHGDIPSKNVTEWIQSEAAEDWGQSKYREVHLGHLHSLNTLQKIEESKSGLIVRYLPTLCASSAWEHWQAYGDNPKTLISFVWDENKGLREQWYTNV